MGDDDWHDNIATMEEVGGNALDVDNILFGFRKVLEVKTAQGSMFFQKMGDRRRLQLVDEYRDTLEKMGEQHPEVLRIMQIDEADRKPEEILKVLKWGELGRPWTMALVHGSLIKPKMSLDTFYDVMAVLPPDDTARILKTVAGMYNPPEDAKEAAKRLVRHSKNFGIPISKDLTMENMTPDLLQVFDEAAQDEMRELKNAN